MQKRKAAAIRAVVFDLDGTLVDSLADIAGAVNSVLVRLGRRPHPLPALKAMVGWGLKRLLVSATAEAPLSEVEFEAALEELLEAYRARPVVHTRAYAGVQGLLTGLAGRAALGVLSNKEHGMTNTIVGGLFPNAGFRAVWGARPGVPHKPDPAALLAMLGEWSIAPEECAYLGDSGVDMETARSAGALPCGALWGYRDAGELRAAGASEVFAAPEDFLHWVRALLAAA